MNTARWVSAWLSLGFFVFCSGAPRAAVLEFVQSLPMPDVSGRIDHLALNESEQLLYVAALGNDSVEVLDLAAAKHVRSLRCGSEPQGILYLPKENRIFVANGGSADVSVLDGSSFRVLETLGGMGDADNVRYDPKAGLVYVGYGSGALAAIRASSAEKVGTIELDGHPESFQLEPTGDRIFINVPEAREIEVADRTQRKVIANWSLTDCRGNFPMALDEGDHRLLVGCRRPPLLVVLDTESGRRVADLPLSGDCDDLFLDHRRRRIYAACGEGFIDVFQQTDADHYERVAHVPTARGARTALYSPARDRLFLAVPHQGSSEAEVRIFRPEQ